MRQKLRGAAAAESPPADQDINEETCGASSEDEMHGRMYSSSRDDNCPVDAEAHNPNDNTQTCGLAPHPRHDPPTTLCWCPFRSI